MNVMCYFCNQGYSRYRILFIIVYAYILINLKMYVYTIQYTNKQFRILLKKTNKSRQLVIDFFRYLFFTICIFWHRIAENFFFRFDSDNFLSRNKTL